MGNEAISEAGTPGRAAISVIMPVFNAEHFLPMVLAPLLEMRGRGEVLEVIVVDDQSTDSSAALAAQIGARVVVSPERGGPGAARNIGSAQAKGEILWFVDSDVIAQPGGPALFQNAFDDPMVVAVFGSYDTLPPARNFASQYKNLSHHYYHQKGRREASTFWAGCGAVRKSAFLEAGGFDVARYTRPSIEDIELGYRLRAGGGRILLLHNLQATHLKRWTVGNVIFTDVVCRALPWARLMLGEIGLTDDLNVSRAERLRAALAGVFFLSILPVAIWPSLFWLPAALLLGAIAVNWDFFAFLRRHRNLGFALLALLFHQLYYVYGSAAFTWCWLESLAGRLRRAAFPA
jgi:glycosyltransferase involved in cell wall biosynthesis